MNVLKIVPNQSVQPIELGTDPSTSPVKTSITSKKPSENY